MNRDLFLRLIDDSRSARTLQVALGPSEIGEGQCRARAWHRLRQTPVTNPDTKMLPAWMGTQIHKGLDRAASVLDPFGERFLRELEVSWDGMVGHVDLYDIEECEAIDYKTITKAKVKDFPSDEQWAQVQMYGWLLSCNSYLVHTVTLVGIPRDGNEDHVVFHSRPYDPLVAAAALAWLADVDAREVCPDAEKPARYFCKDYCDYYDPTLERGCGGLR
jgi:hypothetical protein